MNINEVVKELKIKKRTLIFWVREYGLEPYIIQSNAGNTYSSRALTILKAVKLMKDTDWFSSSFIKKIIDRLKDDERAPIFDGMKELEKVETEIKALFAASDHDAPGIPVPDSTDELTRLEEKIRLFPESDHYQDWLFEAAEICREKLGDYTGAARYYGKLVQGGSSYSQVASIYMDILRDTGLI